MTTIRGSECSEVAKKRSPTPRGGRILRSFSAAEGVHSRATPANIGYAGSLMFGLFLIGWGLSFIWGPISDKFSRTKAIAATVLVYAVFTGAAPTSGCWRSSASSQALASAASGRWPAPTSPRPGRRTGGRWEPGTFTPATTSASSSRRACTIGAAFGWRAMFLCGLFPVVVSIATLLGVKEPERWEHKHQEEQAAPAKQHNPLAVQPPLSRAHCHHVGAAYGLDRRPVGGCGIRADGQRCRGLVDEPAAGDRPDSRRALHSTADFWEVFVV
jgi:MFS family permease